MASQLSERTALPEGYYYPEEAEAQHFHAELQRELPPGHLLYGVPVQTFASRDGSDDTVFQHCNESTRFTVVHLTWIGKTEINPEHPAIVFDGTFAEFLADEESNYGLSPQHP